MSLDLNDRKRGIGLAFALHGLRYALLTERNFQIHIVAGLSAISLGLLLDLSALEWLALLFAIFIVLITEVINTAVENIIDYIKPEIHPHAKQIKDLCAGAVLLAAIHSLIVGAILFLPKIYQYFI